MEVKENLTNVNYWIGDGSGGEKQNQYIVIHYVGAVSSAKNNSDYFKSVNRGASANYFVDEKEIYRVVKDSDSAWHCGSDKYYCEARNYNSIGIEMCCYMNNGKLDVSEKVVERTIELTKELMKKYNIPVSNVVRHYDVTRKVCPEPFVTDINRWNDFINRLTSTSSCEEPHKSTIEIANEVIVGKWGNGEERVKRLTEAGYDYDVIQNEVNRIIYGSNKKSNEEIADEVIAGIWGNGYERVEKLTKAGYDYDIIQDIVNKKLLG